MACGQQSCHNSCTGHTPHQAQDQCPLEMVVAENETASLNRFPWLRPRQASIQAGLAQVSRNLLAYFAQVLYIADSYLQMKNLRSPFRLLQENCRKISRQVVV